jgi:hypothetical protein
MFFPTGSKTVLYKEPVFIEGEREGVTVECAIQMGEVVAPRREFIEENALGGDEFGCVSRFKTRLNIHFFPKFRVNVSKFDILKSKNFVPE